AEPDVHQRHRALADLPEPVPVDRRVAQHHVQHRRPRRHRRLVLHRHRPQLPGGVLMATYLRGPGTAFIGMGFVGSEFVGVGQPSGACADTVLTTDAPAVTKSLHQAVTDTVVTTDAAVTTSATHGLGYGPGTYFVGVGIVSYGFTGMGQAGSFLTAIVTDRMVTTDAAVRSPDSFTRSATDASTTTDAVTESVVLARSATDTVLTTDAASRSTNNVRPVTDTVLTVDVAIGHRFVTLSCSDIVLTIDVAIGAVIKPIVFKAPHRSLVFVARRRPLVLSVEERPLEFSARVP